MPEPLHDVFVSYAHAARPALSEAVCGRLRTLGRRWYRFSALRLYRDKTTQAASEALWPSISDAIEASRHFLLIASPEAAASRWVVRELEHFLATRRRTASC